MICFVAGVIFGGILSLILAFLAIVWKMEEPTEEELREISKKRGNLCL